MEILCKQSLALGSIPQRGFLDKPLLRGRTIVQLPSNKRTCPDARRAQFLNVRARSGNAIIKSQAEGATSSDVGSKDGDLVFVAGATGKVGSRTVRELLKLGFRVRAGVRSIQRAESLVQNVQNMKLGDVEGGTQPIDNLKLVECDLERPDQIGPALGNSSIVICCIGASEKEISDITGPYRIDYVATKNLIDAATSAKVQHFILLTSLGTNKIGFPAAILNLFWGVLIWKRKAEEALLASGLPYTIVRPGGMERPTDSYKETHNITLSEEDTLFGGQVSNLQVAELMAFMAKNRDLSYCKVVEVIAETSAPLTPLDELLKRIPSQREQTYLFKESDNLDGSELVLPESTDPEKETQRRKTAATPLSPYIAYEDLKPPTSPTPTSSTGSVAPKARNIDIRQTATNSVSSSPYLNYEDLKPPSSPTPTPSGSKVEASIAPTSADVASELIRTTSDTVKDPTGSGNSKPDNPFDEKSENIKHHDVSKTRPLSPYAMYEDLKPPSSPMPPPKKL